jgi:ElaB/YqjD/DUF883 family membrane-anchored ribosome-binding protein
MGKYSKLDTAAEQIKAEAMGAADEASSWLGDIGERFNDAIDEYGDAAKRWSETVSTQTKENPLLAVGIAFAAGIVIARILRR